MLPWERVDASDLIVAFYRCWVDDAVYVAYHGFVYSNYKALVGRAVQAVERAREWLFTDRLEASLAAFDYAPGYARKFRVLYVQHERRQHLAWRQSADRLTRPRGRGAEGGTMLSVEEYATLKALAKKAGIPVRSLPKPQRLSLSREDARRLTMLLMTHDRVVITRHGTRLVMLSWDAYNTRVKTAQHTRTFVKHTEPSPNGALPGRHVWHRSCCGSKGPRHMKSCTQVPLRGAQS